MKEQYIKIIKSWFNNHFADLQCLQDRLYILNWARPDSAEYALRYVIDDYRLYISGDIGEAVFVFSETLNLEKLSGYEFAFFMGRLTAVSRDPYSYKVESVKQVFNERLALRLKSILAENSQIKTASSEEEIITQFFQIEFDLFGTYKELYQDFIDHIPGHLGDYVDYIKKHHQFLTAFFGDTDLYEWVYNAGRSPSLQKYAFWLGLKLAAEQFTAKRKTP